MARTELKRLRPQLRRMKREAGRLLRGHNHIFPHTVNRLISESDKTPVLCENGVFPVGERICELPELTREAVTAALSALSSEMQLCGADIETARWQTEYTIVAKALENAADSAYYAGRLFALAELEFESINEQVNPLCKLLSEDITYRRSSPETQKQYRAAISLISFATGIDEKRLVFEYKTEAERDGAASPDENMSGKAADIAELSEVKDSHSPKAQASTHTKPAGTRKNPHSPLTLRGGSHDAELAAWQNKGSSASHDGYSNLGKRIFTDFRRVFPYVRQKKYIFWNVFPALALPLIIALLCGLYALPLLIFPCFAIIKSIADRVTAVSTENGSYLPRLKKSETTAKNLCVLSALIDSEDTLNEAVHRLNEAAIRNGRRNISYCLLCDLPPANSEETPEDNGLLTAMERFSRDGNAPLFIVRRREYSKTQRKFQGFDRKRGAVEQLVRYICAEQDGRDSARNSGSEKPAPQATLNTLNTNSTSKPNSTDTLADIIRRSSNFSSIPEKSAATGATNGTKPSSPANTKHENPLSSKNSRKPNQVYTEKRTPQITRDTHTPNSTSKPNSTDSVSNTANKAPINDISFANEREKPISFRTVYGDRKALSGTDYLMLLDFDTLPLLDCISELCAVAEHPLNADYGIFAPRVSSTLTSCLKTPFSRIFGGNGGCFTASLYDSFSGELYFDCFGEGIFTGKGLVRVRQFYERCCGAFPPETVLSHDILEGGLLNTAYVGDVETADSFPTASRAYFKRQHRWLRGDFQNVKYISDKRLSALTRFKLFDNIRRAMTPPAAFALCFAAAYYNSSLLLLTALLSVGLPFIISLFPIAARGFSFMETRRFFAPIRSNVVLILSQLAAELLLLSKNAAVSLDAAFRTLWRRNISHRNLLQWTTASALDKAGGGAGHLIGAELMSLWLLATAVICGCTPVLVYSIYLLAMPPVMLFCDRRKASSAGISAKNAASLKAQAAQMWHFYEDYVTAKYHFLPPDNVQYAPISRVSEKTSPTNIGMYLLSCVCAEELEIIDSVELSIRVEQTVNTLEQLKKYHGNLYNWYDICTLEPISTFISSVDSGNFLCCMTAVSEFLRGHGADTLARRGDKLTENAELSVFYNKTKRLFSVGVDAQNGEKAPNCYDLLMSEARMLSYFAIASGQVPKNHWRALGRTISRENGYCGCVSWTGTMFEFFMPSLLLYTREGSISYEALEFALRCQEEKKYGGVMGKSESGYYAFDNALNYQYKAHGIQKNALCDGMDREWVISPYSSYIAMPFDKNACINNLVKLEKYGATHPRYGFYEAVDFTPERTGGGYAVVKSHMAHHVGMSIAGVTNTLCDFKLCALFNDSPLMRRADELLDERALTGLLAVNAEPEHEKGEINDMTEEITEISMTAPKINLLSNARLSVFDSDGGLYCGRTDGKSTAVKTEEIARPHGMFFGYYDGGNILSFTKLPQETGAERAVEFSQNETAYYVNGGGICAGMRHSLDGELAVEYRVFAAENTTSAQKKLTLCAYIEPALADDREISAHRAFAQLFLRVWYDEDNRVFFAARKERHSDRETVMCVGFLDRDGENTDFTYVLDRESANIPNQPLGFFALAPERKNVDKAVPEPCIFIRADMTVDVRETRTATMFICYADSVKSALKTAKSVRENGVCENGERVTSPLVRSSLAGRIAAEIMPSALYRANPAPIIREACAKNKLGREALWKHGVSGDKPIVIYDESGGEEVLIQAVTGLNRAGLPCELVITGEGKNTENVYYIPKSAMSPDEMTALYASAAYVYGFPEEYRTDSALPIFPAKSDAPETEQGFTDSGYVVTQQSYPWCNVLANRSFGTLVSQGSLGFTWAMNSRENKLTPWYNDILNDNSGELLLLRHRGYFTDIISGGTAIFGSNSAVYHSRDDGIRLKTTVGVAEKGMAKEIILELYNENDSARDTEISYVATPVLGAFQADSCNGVMLKSSVCGNAVAVENPRSPFGGAMCVSADRACVPTTDRAAFFSGKVGDTPECSASPVAAVTVKLRLPPKRREKIRFILSYTRNAAQPLSMQLATISQRFSVPLTPLYNISTGDKDADTLANVFLPWQTVGCRMWARTGFYQNGGAYGFRDQLQDGFAALLFRPDECLRQIYRSCASQFPEGDALHWWHRLPDGRRGVRTRYSDDLLWLPYVTAEYVRDTGDARPLDKEIYYCCGDTLAESEHEKYMTVGISDVRADVYAHCKKALDKGYAVGMHGLLKIGCGDWNDGYNNVGIKGDGVSVWLSMFYVMTAKAFLPLARLREDSMYAAELQLRITSLETAIDDAGWDGDYYLRAYYDDGSKMGSRESVQCRIDVLPQAFAVLAGLPDEERARKALAFARAELVDSKNKLVRLFSPAFDRAGTHERPGYVMSYPVGVRENGGQYTHAAVWLALAFLRAGDTEYAKKLAEMLLPYDRGEQYKNEPYYMSADVYANPAAMGRGGWSLYTGTAGWLYRTLWEMYRE